MKELLDFCKVCKNYGGHPILKDLDLKLHEGKVIAIVGPSGCGKTTVLNLATNVVTPGGGCIKVHADKIGYVFQEPRLLPWCTLWENIVFGTNEEVDKEKLMQLVRQVGLEDAIDLYPNQLSGGMKQRASILRAFALKPEIIFMDEPFSALDYSSKKQLMHELIQLIDTKKVGALYVTHDYVEAATLADTIIQFQDPKEGKYRKIEIDKPRMERDFDFIKTIEYELLKGVQ